VPELVPPGWPPGVLPPQAPDWERSAVGWLFDLCPPDYRAYEVLRRHPVVLARFAAGHVASGVSAARDGLRTLRAELKGVVRSPWSRRPYVESGTSPACERHARARAPHGPAACSRLQLTART